MQSPQFSARLACIAVLAATLLAAVASRAPADTTFSTWTNFTGSGLWGDQSQGPSLPGNWSTPFFPSNGNGGVAHYAAQISGTVTLNVDVTLDNLTTDAGTQFNLPYDRELTLADSGTLSNNGTITNASTLNFTSGTLAGSGQVVLSNGWISGSLSQSAGHTLSGYGVLNASLANDGLISVNDTTPNHSLALYGNVTQSASGRVVLTGGTLVSDAGTLSGGTLTSTAGKLQGGAFSNGTLQDITLTAGSDLTLNYSTVNVAGTLTNDGTLTDASTLNFTTGTLAGSGRLILSSGWITGTSTQSAGHTISGYGLINASLANDGLISVNDTTPNHSLALYGNVTQSASGRVVLTGGTLVSDAGTLSGGTLTSTAGKLQGGAFSNGTLQDITLTTGSDLTLNYSTVNVAGTLTNDGALTDASTLNFTNATLAGSGQIVLSSGWITGSLSQSAGHTLSGYGVINATMTNDGLIAVNDTTPNHSLALYGNVTQTTQGRVVLNGGTLVSDAGTLSGGILTSTAGKLQGGAFSNGTLQNITLTAGSDLTLNYSTVNVAGTFTNNGTLTNASVLNFSTGTLAGSGQVVLSGGSINGTLSQSANHTISGYGVINATLANDGLILADDTTPGHSIVLSGNVTQSPSGRIVLTGGTLTSNAGTLSGGTLTSVGGKLQGGAFNNGTLQDILLTPGSDLTLSSSNVNIAGTFIISPYALFHVVASLTNNGTIDLAGGTLQLDHGLSPTPVRDQLKSAYDHGLWDGPGISSSLAFLDPYHVTAIGYSTSGPAYTLICTPYGDANLDGIVNADDYALLDRAYARSLTDAHWSDGDFNYDDIIDQSDYLLIDTTYAHFHPLSPAFLSQRESQFGASYVSELLTTVPEPSPLLAACGLALLLPRRRRRQPRT